jgi:hypothetical protein
MLSNKTLRLALDTGYGGDIQGNENVFWAAVGNIAPYLFPC